MRRRRLARVAAFALLGALLLTSASGAKAKDEPAERPPILAYYYIWFDEGSWDRAKTDFPVLGRYSSDDRSVMEQHVRWAQQAGIDGFIVSWKSTPKLDRRLRTLVEVARAADFRLAIIYEGLDFAREPLPVDQVEHDLRGFVADYANDPVFDLFGQPLVIWSGTWKFTPEDIAAVGRAVRPSVLLLASERNVAGIEALNGLVDGVGYYWSSVNPETFPGYPDRLAAMAHAVHQQAGIWIAPAAPGFDARLVGGTTVVPRNDGETLRLELDAALTSDPDAIGLISWNEFSENSHVEPSERNGFRYLDIVRSYAPSPSTLDGPDSSDEGRPLEGPEEAGRTLAVGLILGLTLAGTWAVLRRSRRHQPESAGPK